MYLCLMILVTNKFLCLCNFLCSTQLEFVFRVINFVIFKIYGYLRNNTNLTNIYMRKFNFCQNVTKILDPVQYMVFVIAPIRSLGNKRVDNK